MLPRRVCERAGPHRLRVCLVLSPHRIRPTWPAPSLPGPPHLNEARPTTTMRVPPAAIHFPAEDRALILQQIDAALTSGQLTLGALGRTLEHEFAEYHGVKHAVAVNSGTCGVEIP